MDLKFKKKNIFFQCGRGVRWHKICSSGTHGTHLVTHLGKMADSVLKEERELAFWREPFRTPEEDENEERG